MNHIDKLLEENGKEVVKTPLDKLHDGIKNGGVSLTPDECSDLLEKCNDPFGDNAEFLTVDHLSMFGIDAEMASGAVRINDTDEEIQDQEDPFEIPEDGRESVPELTHRDKGNEGDGEIPEEVIPEEVLAAQEVLNQEAESGDDDDYDKMAKKLIGSVAATSTDPGTNRDQSAGDVLKDAAIKNSGGDGSVNEAIFKGLRKKSKKLSEGKESSPVVVAIGQ